MNIISIIIALLYLLMGQGSSDSSYLTPVKFIDPKIVEPFLAPGLDEIKKAVELREKFIKNGFDFNSASHIPELEQQLPILMTYYEKATLDAPKKKKALTKMLDEMRKAFQTKRMSMAAWTGFHNRLNRLFSAEGSTTRADLSPPEGQALRWFIYEREGILGLQALNLAFVSDIEAIPAATTGSVRADGIDYDPVFLALHDAGHFYAFKSSPYAFKRFKHQLREIYERIEAQTNPMERARDHLVLFMFIHETLPSTYRYHHSINDAFEDSYQDMTQTLQIRFGRGKDGVKYAIFREVAGSSLAFEGLAITKIEPKHYKIEGFSISTNKPVVHYAKVIPENNKVLIHIIESPTKTRIIDTSMVQFSDFDPMLKVLYINGTYSELNIAPALDEFALRFLKKYRENHA